MPSASLYTGDLMNNRNLSQGNRYDNRNKG